MSLPSSTKRTRAAEKARDHIAWLESPIHPQNVAHWAKERGPRMLLVIAAALFLLLFVRSALGESRGPWSADAVALEVSERGAPTRWPSASKARPASSSW